MKMKLGVTAKDSITGFEGKVLGFCEYISGCNQVLIQDETAIDLSVASPGPDKPAPRI